MINLRIAMVAVAVVCVAVGCQAPGSGKASGGNVPSPPFTITFVNELAPEHGNVRVWSLQVGDSGAPLILPEGRRAHFHDLLGMFRSHPPEVDYVHVYLQMDNQERHSAEQLFRATRIVYAAAQDAQILRKLRVFAWLGYGKDEDLRNDKAQR
jgi:hypothetical protein